MSMKGKLLAIAAMVAMGENMMYTSTAHHRIPRGNTPEDGIEPQINSKSVYKFIIKGEEIAAINRKTALKIYNYKKRQS